jgi:asparagine synthase (glutamine-hydrolysing)
MCGLCGEVNFDDAPASLSNIEKMTEVMHPRGPNGVGAMARDRVALGHRRLSIIDLSEKGLQPMTDSDLGLTVAFNGATCSITTAATTPRRWRPEPT